MANKKTYTNVNIANKYRRYIKKYAAEHDIFIYEAVAEMIDFHMMKKGKKKIANKTTKSKKK